ncbi:hypothetical protein ACG83_08230 [Frankia sp. R43]|uniref:hypothetical protein n=1 Tax=Frankia sp. R43 TaxID=269536 RepID=UPI0006DADD1B|nr:hypothetical protein [Frankia sp. R43]KPM55365.1 hypothetical protein ACG83_08230 [Frankia sp. R43]
MTTPRHGSTETQLARLVRDRNWTVDDLRHTYTATSKKMELNNTVSDRQAKRWLAGMSTPHPSARRVLQEMFHLPISDLLAPADPGYRESQGPTPPALSPRRHPTHVQSEDEPQAREEVSPSRRRDLLGTGVILAASATTASAAAPVDATTRAAAISRAIATSEPDPLSVAQLQHGIQRLNQIYATTPHTALIGPVEDAWDFAEAHLESRVTGTSRRDLELLAGQYSFYRGYLAFDTGDDDGALTFLVLAAQHARAAGNPLLAESAALIRSAVAFFQNDFDTAATVAASALETAQPYTTPLLAAAAARAHAQRGDANSAQQALDTMRDNVWTGRPLFGGEIGDEEHCEGYTAVVLGYLRRGSEAEPHARRSLTLLEGTGRYMSAAGSHLALARALLYRDRPDPEQAAAAVIDAINITDGKDSTIRRASGIYHRHLSTRPAWAALPSVRDLGDRLPAPRESSGKTIV